MSRAILMNKRARTADFVAFLSITSVNDDAQSGRWTSVIVE